MSKRNENFLPIDLALGGRLKKKRIRCLNVEVIRLDGPDGEAFLKADLDDNNQKRLDALKKTIGETK